jgi:hypothetical protein
VITAYLTLGNATLVQGMTGIPAQTIRFWKMQPWWREIEAQIREEDNLTQSVKLKKIVDKTLDLVLDRVENGDFQYDPKSGKLVRRPVLLRDAGKVGVSMMERRDMLQMIQVQKLKQPSVEESLKKIAETFANIAKGKNVKKELQAGVCELSGQTGSDQGSDSEESGPSDNGEMGGEEDFGGCGSQDGDIEGGDEQDLEPSDSNSIRE